MIVNPHTGKTVLPEEQTNDAMDVGFGASRTADRLFLSGDPAIAFLHNGDKGAVENMGDQNNTQAQIERLIELANT
ncbi:MAG: hypothetical protein IH607_09115, partial [Firmicutes bacterium]|nr:hypothetical protein [Bacillota bacterium]